MIFSNYDKPETQDSYSLMGIDFLIKTITEDRMNKISTPREINGNAIKYVKQFRTINLKVPSDININDYLRHFFIVNYSKSVLILNDEKEKKEIIDYYFRNSFSMEENIDRIYTANEIRESELKYIHNESKNLSEDIEKIRKQRSNTAINIKNVSKTYIKFILVSGFNVDYMFDVDKYLDYFLKHYDTDKPLPFIISISNNA